MKIYKIYFPNSRKSQLCLIIT